MQLFRQWTIEFSYLACYSLPILHDVIKHTNNKCLLTVVLSKQLSKCQNKSVITEKRALKRSRSWKKFGLGGNLQLHWLTTICLCGHSCSPVFSLHQCLQRPVKNKCKQIRLTNHHSRVPRWRAFNFTPVPIWCVLGMQSNSGMKAEF